MDKPESHTRFDHQDSQPWYKNYIVIIFVIGLPLFVVVTCIWFVFYSIEVKDSVVRDDWYMDGKTLYQDVSRDKLAHDLALHGEMVFTKVANTNDYEVTFTLNYPKDSLKTKLLKDGSALGYPDALNLSISHATDINKDHDAILKRTNHNSYDVIIKDFDPLSSKYYIQVSHDGQPNWRLRQVAQLPTSKTEFKPLTSFDVSS